MSLIPLFAQEAPEKSLQIVDVVRDALLDLVASLRAFIPGFIGGLVIFVVGCIVAAIVRRIITAVLNKMGLETISERVGLQEMLHGIGLKTPLPIIIGKVVFWVLMLMFTMTATQVVPGLSTISEVLQNIVDYLPRAASAILFALIGLVVARLVHGALLAGAQGVGLEFARPLANVLYGFLVVVIVTLAIGQMDIETELLSKTIQICLSGVALSLALAIGLGMKGVSRNIASGVYARDLFKPGMEVTLDGKTYKVAGVGATSTRLEGAGGVFVMVPNWEMVDTTIHGRTASNRK